MHTQQSTLNRQVFGKRVLLAVPLIRAGPFLTRNAQGEKVFRETIKTRIASVTKQTHQDLGEEFGHGQVPIIVLTRHAQNGRAFGRQVHVFLGEVKQGIRQALAFGKRQGNRRVTKSQCRRLGRSHGTELFVPKCYRSHKERLAIVIFTGTLATNGFVTAVGCAQGSNMLLMRRMVETVMI